MSLAKSRSESRSLILRHILPFNTSKSQGFQTKQNTEGAKMWRKKISLTHKHQPKIPVKDKHEKDLGTIYKSKKTYIEG